MAMSEHQLITPRRNFLIRALGLTAAGATMSIPVVTLADARSRIDHHKKGLMAVVGLLRRGEMHGSRQLSSRRTQRRGLPNLLRDRAEVTEVISRARRSARGFFVEPFPRLANKSLLGI
jgi:hypothetical protein